MSEQFRAKLEPSEMAIFRSASEIYAAHISAGNVTDDNADDFIKKSISDSLKICSLVEKTVISDSELG